MSRGSTRISPVDRLILAIKAACLALGALGLAGMWLAIFADVGVMVLAVLNATRALYTRDLVRRNGLDK